MQVGLQKPSHLEPVSGDGSGSEGQDRADVRAAIREALEEVRERMERDGRFFYRGRWQTCEEIKTLQWRALKEELTWVRDVVLVLLVSAGIVAFAYQFLLLLLP